MLLLRRIHLYAALLMGPWVLMYAVSTFVMNHRELFRGAPAQAVPVLEREFKWAGDFPPDALPRDKGRMLLQSLDLEGAFTVREEKDGALVVQRQSAVEPRRIRYDPATRMVRIERTPFRTSQFLERMHRRRGWQHGFATDNAWALSVDVFIAAMIFWAVSGIWLWWEMKSLRGWGLAAAAAGAALFALFLAVG